MTRTPPGAMPTFEKTLATMREGEKATIHAVDTSDPQVRRLMTLGLVEGAELEHATSALGGDPLEFILFGQAISLRREQARAFSVVPVTNGAGVSDGALE